MNIRSPYDGSRKQVLIGGGESMTREAFADELDINKIVERYARGGQLPPTRADARYGDVADIGDYKSALDFVFASKDKLADLPELARDQLSADPEAYWLRLEAAEDRDALVELGLVEALPPVAEPPVEPVVDPPVEPVVPAPPGGSRRVIGTVLSLL